MIPLWLIKQMEEEDDGRRTGKLEENLQRPAGKRVRESEGEGFKAGRETR